MQKLLSYGIKDTEFSWFHDYLFNRQQFVSYEKEISHPRAVTCGVPQGSILGPLLFLLCFSMIFLTVWKPAKLSCSLMILSSTRLGKVPRMSILSLIWSPSHWLPSWSCHQIIFFSSKYHKYPCMKRFSRGLK